MTECPLEAASILNTSICYNGMKLSLSWCLGSDEYFVVAMHAWTIRSNFFRVTPRQASLSLMFCNGSLPVDPPQKAALIFCNLYRLCLYEYSNVVSVVLEV